MDPKIYLDEQVFLDSEIYASSSLSDFILDMFIGTDCNLRCKHCYFGANYKVDSIFDINDWIQIINDFATNGCTHFHISGRESLLSPNIDAIINHLINLKQKQFIYCGIITNGTSQPPSIYQSILDKIDYMEFSIDGLSVNHDYMRGAGTFDKVYSTLTALKHKNKINIAFSLFQNNKSDLFEIILLFSKLGIRKFFCSPIQPVGSALANKLMIIDEKEYIDFVIQSIDFLSTSQIRNIDLKFCLTWPYVDYILQNNIFSDKITEYLVSLQPIYWECQSNVLELSLQMFTIPYFTQASITNDGYLLPTAESIGYTSSTSNKYTNINDFLKLRKKSVLQYLKK